MFLHLSILTVAPIHSISLKDKLFDQKWSFEHNCSVPPVDTNSGGIDSSCSTFGGYIFPFPTFGDDSLAVRSHWIFSFGLQFCLFSSLSCFKGGPASSYATVGRDLIIFRPLKPSNHIKVIRKENAKCYSIIGLFKVDSRPLLSLHCE